MAGSLSPFRDSSSLVDSADALRARLVEDGYLYLPGLLPAANVQRVRAELLEALAAAGWLAPDTDPLDAWPGAPRTDRDDSWWEGYNAVLALENFNRLAHDPALTSLMRRLLGDDLLVHPQKIPRMSFPGAAYPTLPHQDFVFIQGSADVLTTWLPLGACSAALGGLRILAGSDTDGLRRVRNAYGVGNLTSEDVALDDPRWRGTDSYRAGDVLVFHSLTVHYAPANGGDRLRLSADFRYQSAADPVSPDVLLPTAHGTGRVPNWWGLIRGWSSTRWCEVPYPISVAPYRLEDMWDTPRSRLLEGDAAS